MSKPGFASTGDIKAKKITFSEVGPGLHAFTAEGDPNSGIIIGDDGCIVMDAQATPAMASLVIERVRQVTDKPIKYVVLSHYHAVRVLGASAYKAEAVVASQETRRLVAERGQQDWDSEYGRFPRLFADAQSIPGLTWPHVTFTGELTLYLGKREVRLMQIGAGTRQATLSLMFPMPTSCSQAISSNITPLVIAGMPTYANGRRHSARSSSLSRAPSCQGAAMRLLARRKCTRRSP